MILITLRHLPGPFIWAAGGALLLSSCFPTSETPESEAEGISVNRTITDSKGRRLEVNIIGRSADSITFLRASDGQRFTLPVTNLSTEDQSFITGLPMASPPPDTGGVVNENLSNASGPLGFAIDRKKEIQKKLDLIAEEIPKFSKAPSKVNSLNRERDKLTLELEAVNQEINSLKSK